VSQLFWSWHSGVSNVSPSRRNYIHVSTSNPRRSAPPPTRLNPTPLPQTIPQWQELTLQLQSDLLSLLTRLVQQHLGHATPDATEVANDNP
jgi:hypothetical protein